MSFTVTEEGNYLVVEGKYKLPRWFCREVGLKPGKWEVEKVAQGVELKPREANHGRFIDVFKQGRRLRAICQSEFCRITGISESDICATGFRLRESKSGE